MSSELERLLRQAQKALPDPEAGVTRRAREKALAAIGHPRRFRLRSPLALAAAIGMAVGLGIGVGALVTPSGTAAEGPSGLGFLPAEGWSVYQTGTRATVARPAYALASNVSLDPEDFVDGRPDPSLLPYSTLLALPRHGIVVVADFTLRREHENSMSSGLFRPQELPLDLREAEPADMYGTQIRPDRPLGQYQLRADVEGYAVDVRFYFGTARPSRLLVAAAQRQLERLIVSPIDSPRTAERPRDLALAPAATAVAAASRIIDRTFRCTVSEYGGIPKIEVNAKAGLRQNSRLKWLAQAGFTTFEPARKAEDSYLSLAGLTAGWPPPPTVPSGGLSVSLERCIPTVERATLTTRGLSGGPVDRFGDIYECFPPRTILIRIRALFRSPTSLRVDRRGERSLAAIARITQGSIVAQTRTGRRIAYAQVFESGKARLFTAPDCVPDSG